MLQTPWLDVKAKRVQLDVAGVIDSSGRAPSYLIEQDAQDKPDGGLYPTHGKVYLIQLYLIKFVSHLRQVDGFHL
jgi:hypothetical protein